MRLPGRPLRCLAVAAALLLPTAAPALASVQALLDLSSPAGGPFPSDRFTLPTTATSPGCA